MGLCPTLVWGAGACRRHAVCGAQGSVCEPLPTPSDAAVGPSRLILREAASPPEARAPRAHQPRRPHRRWRFLADGPGP